VAGVLNKSPTQQSQNRVVCASQNHTRGCVACSSHHSLISAPLTNTHPPAHTCRIRCTRPSLLLLLLLVLLLAQAARLCHSHFVRGENMSAKGMPLSGSLQATHPGFFV